MIGSPIMENISKQFQNQIEFQFEFLSSWTGFSADVICSLCW